MTNTVFANPGSDIYSTVSQDLYQTCDTSDGPICSNINSLTISGPALSNTFLEYVAGQSLENNDGADTGGNGGATISYTSTATNTPYQPNPVTPATQPGPGTTQPGTITNPS